MGRGVRKLDNSCFSLLTGGLGRGSEAALLFVSASGFGFDAGKDAGAPRGDWSCSRASAS